MNPSTLISCQLLFDYTCPRVIIASGDWLKKKKTAEMVNILHKMVNILHRPTSNSMHKVNKVIAKCKLLPTLGFLLLWDIT